MSKYTRQLILNSIQYWKNMLDENTSNDYRAFFCKDINAHKFKSMNLSAPECLKSAINESCISNGLENGICIYNSSSYMNKQRMLEHANLYKSEKDLKTQPTAVLIDEIKKYCKHDMRDWTEGLKAFDLIFNFLTYDYDSKNEIAGNAVLIDFPFNLSHYTVKQHVNRISRIAQLLGYNYVVHETSKTLKIGNADYCLTSVQFEATYFSSNVKYGDILWHVTPKSHVDRILRTGLLPDNKNKHGFSYKSRIYCFIDRYDLLFKDYAKVSGKQSKKFILNNNLKQELMEWYELVQEKTCGKVFNTREFAVMSIDTARLEDVKFFRDNTFDINGNFIAAYTTQAIQPKAISLAFTFVAE